MSYATQYTRLAIILHWLVALLICCAFPLGLYMHDLHLSPRKLQLYSYHKWIGITVLALAVVRISWRITHQPPPLPSGMPRWQQIAAHGVHHSFYLLLLAIPLSGWLMSSALGVPVVWLGVVHLPDLVAKNKELGDMLKVVHKLLNFTLMALFVVHVGTAVQHQFWLRDGLLARMLPFLDQGAGK